MKNIKAALSLLLVLLVFPIPGYAATSAAEENFSPLFIAIGDAMMKVKADDWPAADAALRQFSQSWETIRKDAGKEEQAVHQSFAAAEKAMQARDKAATLDHLSALSSSLLAFEKKTNPVDQAALRQEFQTAITPALRAFEEALASGDDEKVGTAYKQILSIWTKKESIVREQSLVYYGQIETRMGLLRIAVSKDAYDYGAIQSQYDQLSEWIADFAAGKEAASSQIENASPQTLMDLLSQAIAAIEQQQPQLAAQTLEQFIAVWPAVEGEVLTRNASLYNDLENHIPLIAGQLSSSDSDLEHLKSQLAAFRMDISLLQGKQYTEWDAASILLREGLEALLIVSALIAFLRKTNQFQYQKWIWLGAFAGVVMSVIMALAIHTLFSAAIAGSNREILEGVTGIMAVAMMIGVGIWLHQKSQMQNWNRYIHSKMGKALSTGSVLTMALISFLSIFREGAETIIFYTGMSSSISTEKLLSGIGIAVVILVVFAYLFIRFSAKIPLGLFFKAATLLIYLLAFKILGVSLHALQLTNIISISQVKHLPIVDFIGFFPTWETLLPQLALLAILISSMMLAERKQNKHAA